MYQFSSPPPLKNVKFRNLRAKDGKKTSQNSSRGGKSRLVFFSKSPPIGLVRNLLVSLVVVLTM